ENRLPAGANDPTYGAQMRPPIYYAMLAGPQRLHDVLNRSLSDGDPALALDAIDALQRTAGTDALANRGAARQPLINALSYPDRRVRFNAAMALANAKPRQSYEGAYRVVPVLAEAVRQSEQRYAVVLGNDQETVNKTMAMLEQRGFQTIGGKSLGEINEQIELAPGIDLLVLNQSLDEVLASRQNAQANYKLATTPILALVSTGDQIQLRQLSNQDTLLSTAVVPAEDDVLSNAIENAATSFVGSPISAPEAEEFALAALESLRDISQGSSGGVYDVTDGLQALIQALGDSRESVAAKASQVLALIDRPVAQQAIADAALKTTDQLQIAMLESLADSATHYGNNLSQLQTNQLLELAIESQGDLAVAAGE
ncbi:MAG: HEAT repeat domain-containing protein, partial [Rhodospirillales bacterium]|nr:HEAT repeat domain-containing protein [Rhodospirillales bacterium]